MALDAVKEPIFLHDKNFRILRCNKAYQQYAGLPFEQIIGQSYYTIFPKADGPLRSCLRAMEKVSSDVEIEEICDGAAIYQSRAYSISSKEEGYLCSVHIMEDITERKQIERDLQESKMRYKRITDGLTDYQYTVRIENGQAAETLQSPACEKATGYTAADFASHPDLWLQMVAPEDRGMVLERVKQVLAGEDVPPIEHRIIRKDGSLRWVRDSIILFKDAAGKLRSYDGVISDITERKLHEELTAGLLNIYTASESLDWKTVLRQGLDTLQHLTDSRIAFLHFVNENESEISLAMWSSDTLDHYCKATNNGHYPVAEAGIWADCIRLKQPVIINDYASAPGKKGLPEGHAPLQRFISAPILEGTQVRMIIGVGNAAKEYDEHSAEMVNLYGYTLYRIVQRKQAETAIQHANRALTSLSMVNRTLVRATDENELLQAICQAIVEQHGYRLAWVGYVQHDENKSIKVMARAGHDNGFLDALQLTWAETEFGMGPSGRAVRMGKTQICQNLASDPLYQPWRDEALRHGFVADIALPLLRRSGAVFGILHVYAPEMNAFTPAEAELLEEMAGDLAFGIRSLHVRHERDQAHEEIRQHSAKLQNSLEDTVRAIASIVELRDPYTAGHQSRVADLAAAIARQMELSDSEVHGIHLAGVLHDLGKIQIPSEILSKPGRISTIEHSLIKTHPQAGHDILKGIDFPWPIAKMVLQHHERLDGSGYPNGLKNDGIILGARILAVADVVEAISSHRPYRPGLGVDVALAEITNHRGTQFDPQVVDACLVLIRDRGYQFK